MFGQKHKHNGHRIQWENVDGDENWLAKICVLYSIWLTHFDFKTARNSSLQYQYESKI